MAVLGLGGCALAGRPPPSEPPLLDEGSLRVYLGPIPHEGRRLSFTVTGLSAVAEGGEEVPLQLQLDQVVAAELVRDERLLATARLPPGRYQGLRLAAASARLVGEEGPTDLLLPLEPTRIEAPFDVRRGRAGVLTLALDAARSLQDGFGFTPTFTGLAPARPAPGLTGACVDTRSNDVTLFDTQTRVVTGVVATGLTPRGLALDAPTSRAWVALSGQDELEVLDLMRGEVIARIALRGGDEPRALLLLPDRRTLLVLNFRSQTAAFVDTGSTQEVARVSVGEGPWSVVQPPGSNRAVVVNRRSSTLTIIDLATRQAIATIPTDPEPLFAQSSRDGSRLYLVHAGSLYMTEYALPALTVTRRVRVGLGVSALKVDPRTDLIYVAHGGQARLEVFDTVSALPVDAFELPGPTSQLAIDDSQDQLYALIPSRRAVAVLDLTSRRVLSVLEVGGDPYEVKLAGERK
jgi:YVTN family beta-propeller protein